MYSDSSKLQIDDQGGAIIPSPASIPIHNPHVGFVRRWYVESPGGGRTAVAATGYSIWYEYDILVMWWHNQQAGFFPAGTWKTVYVDPRERIISLAY